MTLITPVHIERSEWPICHDDVILTLGSCFSDHIATCLMEHGFCVQANPYGTLYNPVSIAHHIDEAIATYHPTVVMITLGTSWVYVDKQSSLVVDNCQKRPATDFLRRRLTVEEIVDLWQPILQRYSDLRFIFTVSPIRHKKDGLHANQISKAILLEAIDEMIESTCHRNKPSYFPSYEILLDELRDYRFYADDLVHPAPLAIRYIWERFAETYLYDESTRAAMRELYQYHLDTQHRPLHPDSDEAAAFACNLAKRRVELQSKYPWIQ